MLPLIGTLVSLAVMEHYTCIVPRFNFHSPRGRGVEVGERSVVIFGLSRMYLWSTSKFKGRTVWNMGVGCG